MEAQDDFQKQMDDMFNGEVKKARTNHDKKTTKMKENLIKNKKRNSRMSKVDSFKRFPDKNHKLSPGFCMQLKKSKKVIELDPLS